MNNMTPKVMTNPKRARVFLSSFPHTGRSKRG
jgi:hypothetical protein